MLHSGQRLLNHSPRDRGVSLISGPGNETMTQEIQGASADADRAVVNGAGQAVSALRASVPSAGDLCVWWVPQIPMKAFYVNVPGLAEASLILDTLGRYDAFQFENNVKPDYCNAGGLIEYDATAGEWFDWQCPVTWDDFEAVRRDPVALASAIEARRAETQSGSVHESAAPEGGDAR